MDTLTPSERSARMSRVRYKDTKPELAVRRLVFSMGYRFRLHSKLLPGRPDLVFPGLKKVIFVHGCFWHRHPAKTCALARLPKSRLDFWLPKLEANRRRDVVQQRKIRRMGWSVMVVWECQVRKLPALGRRLRGFLEGSP
ncbi:very short patch repair endonuclease [Hyalangium gracile]|uniref:very short patch repair endonuclease n=1 Tax=Hyalangium gracile TaxID=394092 RepID=UPI001CCB19F2|nr:very short patch repair endonuclease [Hyalangium gracile]